MSSFAGLNRIVSPVGATPYHAWRLDPAPDLEPDELAMDVTVLNLDATSFQDLMRQHGGDHEAITSEILAIVAERGKLHNPRTGSGGVMAGRIVALGRGRQGEVPLGSSVATLVSNTLVPLTLRRVRHLTPENHQVWVEGRAVLSPAAKYALIPEDLPFSLALSLFDVCGVVPQTQRLAQPGARILVIGAAGKAGLLATYAAADQVGPTGQVIALVPLSEQVACLEGLPPWVTPLVADATRPPSVLERFLAITGEALADVVVDCANRPGTETAAVACCRDNGEVYFFNMATSFQAAALGAEVVGRDVRMLIGFGLLPEAPERALQLIRHHSSLRARLDAIASSRA